MCHLSSFYFWIYWSVLLQVISRLILRQHFTLGSVLCCLAITVGYLWGISKESQLGKNKSITLSMTTNPGHCILAERASGLIRVMVPLLWNVIIFITIGFVFNNLFFEVPNGIKLLLLTASVYFDLIGQNLHVLRFPTNKRLWTNASLVLVHRLRRWTNTKPTSVQRLMRAMLYDVW